VANPPTRGSGESFADKFARRLQYAVFLYQLKHYRNVTQIWLAQEVSKQLRLKASLTSESARRWLAGLSVPDPETIEAIAVVIECDPGWLTYGEASQAPPPGKPDSPYDEAREMPKAAIRPRKKADEPVERPSARKKKKRSA
jgi:transcriptional regulator with XRE-family HTH domain